MKQKLEKRIETHAETGSSSRNLKERRVKNSISIHPHLKAFPSVNITFVCRVSLPACFT